MGTYRGVSYHMCHCDDDRVSGRRLRPGPKYWIPERYFSGEDRGERDSPHFNTKRDIEREVRRLQRAAGSESQR
jgi:hypothetical protein